ncbi:hypothetical protein QBC37DRAFT_129272 [Rhypophila decipiens]|uniref:Uncharacterized protein n=1 Tax=Rhypophila decipiens TaxID=261697 RepID=A0AAN6Y9Q1_9PEZI|nr:hypothetical protein QBC37DRAFT_129272 [Rhypophila decipiens]
MAPGSRSRPPSLRRQSQPVYPLPMIIEDVAGVAAAAPIVPERSPRRTRPASLPGLPSAPYGGGLSRNSSTASSRPASERAPSSLSISNAGSGSAARDGVVKTEAPRRHDPERHRVLNRMAKRGGWYKLILISILLAGIIIGLGVGLTLGLRKRNDRAPPPQLPVDLFPAGLYAFTTALTNISTACLPSSFPTEAWQCLSGPSTSNASVSTTNPNMLSTTYHWIIEPTSPFSYVISSSPPPSDNQTSLDQGATTLPTFTNLSLTLHDANQATERFTFSFTMPKSVRVEIPLNSSSNSSSSSAISARRATALELDTRRLSRRQQQDKQKQITCFFNTTTMSATIWTRMRASFPQNIPDLPTPVNASRTSFAPWPFRVEVTEVELGSDLNSTTGMPECKGSDGKVVPLPGLVARDISEMDDAVAARRRWVEEFPRIKTRGMIRRQEEETQSNECSCRYANYELESTHAAGSDAGRSSSVSPVTRSTSTSVPTTTSAVG